MNLLSSLLSSNINENKNDYFVETGNSYSKFRMMSNNQIVVTDDSVRESDMQEARHGVNLSIQGDDHMAFEAVRELQVLYHRYPHSEGIAYMYEQGLINYFNRQLNAKIDDGIPEVIGIVRKISNRYDDNEYIVHDYMLLLRNVTCFPGLFSLSEFLAFEAETEKFAKIYDRDRRINLQYIMILVNVANKHYHLQKEFPVLLQKVKELYSSFGDDEMAGQYATAIVLHMAVKNDDSYSTMQFTNEIEPLYRRHSRNETVAMRYQQCLRAMGR
jgi:hypothetical protein